jgi:hypothetical protein
VHRIIVKASAGEVDATLYDESDPLVIWATEHDLASCAERRQRR